MGRPKKTTPTYRVSLSLDEADHDLLRAWAFQSAKHEATLAAQVLVEVLRAAATDRGDVDIGLIENAFAALRGDQVHPPADQPRWRWPLDVLLADRKLWEWYPELCALLGPDPRPAGEDSFDVLDYLFPAVAGPRGSISWRSMDYPLAAEQRRRGEASRPLRPIWERVIRHVVVALSALETSQDPSALLDVEGRIRYGWLSTLRSLAGETDRGGTLPAPRLPSKPLV